MTEGTRRGRTVWPSLVALFGTIAVVFGLLWLFGNGTGASDDDGGLATEEAGFLEDAEATEDAETTEGDDDDDDEGGQSAEGEDPGEDGSGEEPGEPVVAPEELRSPVGILNSTSTAGLAANLEERVESGGWTVTATGNLTSQQLAESTIFYPTDALLASAEALQAQFPDLRHVVPTDEGPPNLNRQNLVVVLGEDYAEAHSQTGSG